jgi:ABC-2 type transport system permease protein
MVMMRHALRAEWTKLRTVRSSAWASVALVGGMIGLTVLGCATASTQGGSPGAPGDDDIVLFSLAGVYLGQIGAVVLATLVITSEYGTGMIRATFAAMPRRGTVVAAKVAVVGAVTLVLGQVASFASFAVGQQLLQENGYTYENGYPAATLADWTTLWAVMGTGLYLAVIALLSLGVGAIVRHTAGAISAVLAVLYVPQIMIGLASDELADVVQSMTPMSAGLALQQTTGRVYNAPIGPYAGLAVAAAWAAVALAVGSWTVRHRDA